MNIKFLFPFLFLIFFSTFALAVVPDVNVVAPISGTYSQGATVSLDFNMSDDDTNASEMTFDLNYSISTTQGTGTSIFPAGTNVWDTLTCDTNDFQPDNPDYESANCTYDWAMPSDIGAGCFLIGGSTPPPTGCDYYITINITDEGGDSDYNAGASTFRVTTTADVNVNISNIGLLINNATTFVDLTMFGVSQQGDLIGLAIGLTIAISLLIVVIFSVINVIPKLIEKVKRLK